MDPLMMAIAGNAVGSFLLGKEKREARLEDQKLKQQQFKMLMDAQKIKDAKEERLAAKEERISNIFSSLFGPELSGGNAPATGGQPATPQGGLQFGETFGKESSAATQPQTQQQSRLMDILSDPIKSAALKAMTGIDFLGAATNQRQAGAEQRHVLEFLYRMQNDAINRQMQAGQGSWAEEDAPGGGRRPVFRPSNPGAAGMFSGGGAGLGQQPPKLGQQPPNVGGSAPAKGNYSKLPETFQPISVDDLPMWRHPQNKRPQPGMNPEQAKQQGFVRFAATDIPKIDMLENGLDIINTIENLMLSAGIPTAGESNRLPGLIRSGKATLQLGKEGQSLAKLRDFIDGNKSTIARIGGEVGNLAAQEQEDVKSALGKISDAGPKAWEQFELVKQKFNRIKARKYGLMSDKVSPNVDYVFNPLTNKLEPAK